VGEGVRDDARTYPYPVILSVFRSRRAAALVAPSGDVKSTTTWGLLHHGFKYLSDEFGACRSHNAARPSIPTRSLSQGGIIELDKEILTDLFARQRSFGSLNLKIAHHLITRYTVAGKIPVAPGKVAILWENLLLDQGAARNLVSFSRTYSLHWDLEKLLVTLKRMRCNEATTTDMAIKAETE
jgi:hypothetical protein